MFGMSNNSKEQDIVRTMILEEKIKLYPFKDMYRVYGDTFEDRDKLKKVGIAFKQQYDGVVISKEDLEKLLENDTPLQRKIEQVIDESRQKSRDNISKSILDGAVTLYLVQDIYKTYGIKMDQKKDFYNAGFEFKETDEKLGSKNFVIDKEDFEKSFSPEVQEYVDKFNQKKNYHKQQTQSHEHEMDNQEMESA